MAGISVRMNGVFRHIPYMRNARTLHWPHFLAANEEQVVLPFLWMGTILLMATTLGIYAYSTIAGF